MCYKYCRTCSGPSDTECTSCYPNFIYNGNSCICDSNDYRTINSVTNECLCSQKFYDVGILVCDPCHYTWFFIYWYYYFIVQLAKILGLIA